MKASIHEGLIDVICYTLYVFRQVFIAILDRSSLTRIFLITGIRFEDNFVMLYCGRYSQINCLFELHRPITGLHDTFWLEVATIHVFKGQKHSNFFLNRFLNVYPHKVCNINQIIYIIVLLQVRYN